MEAYALRRSIRAKLENGHLLPRESISHVRGGPGNMETCDGCEEPVAREQLVMEGATVKGERVLFHDKCFYVWSVERMSMDASHEHAR